MYTEQVTQALGLCTPLHPQVLNNGTNYCGPIDMSKFERAFFMLDLGAITSSGSITATLQESDEQSDNFTTVSASSVTLTALTTASKLYTQEVRADQLSKRYVRLKVQETAGQNVYAQCTGFGFGAYSKPGKANNSASVSTQNVAS